MIKYNLDKKYTDVILPACAAVSCSEFESRFKKVDQRELLEVCRKNEIASIVGHYLAEHVGAGGLLPEWAEEVEQMAAKTGGYLKELSRVAGIFEIEGIALIGLKNCGIAANLIRIPALFPMGDVDVLVAREDFPRAHELLEAEGYELKAPNKYKKADFNEGYRNGSNEYDREIAPGMRLWFELIWKPVDGRFIAESQEPQGNLLVTESIANAETGIRNLNPVHNLLQVCIHTAKHSYVRAPGFRLHLDVHRIVGTTDIDWEKFLAMVGQHKVCTIVYFSLIMPKIMFGTKVPENVIRAVRPGWMKRKAVWNLLNRAGIFWPEQRKFSLARFIVFTALLHDTPRTIFELVLEREMAEGSDAGKQGTWSRIAGLGKRLFRLIFHHTGT